jgi:hypothetical protein
MNPSVKVAQPGWSAPTAPDWALVFSSDWPSLTIAFEVTLTPTQIAALTGLPTVKHGLGFVPLVMAWVTYNNQSYGRLSGTQFEFDNTNIYLLLDNLDVTLTIRCYNVNITQEASYPLPTSAGAKQAPDRTTFIKVAKTNRAITSPNLNDFVLNSLAQSPAILNVATQSGQYYRAVGAEGAPFSIVYPLQTAYIPWVAAAIGIDGDNQTYSYYDPTAINYNEASNSLSLYYGNQGTLASLIVMRDPLFYPNTVRVVY